MITLTNVYVPRHSWNLNATLWQWYHSMSCLCAWGRFQYDLSVHVSLTFSSFNFRFVAWFYRYVSLYFSPRFLCAQVFISFLFFSFLILRELASQQVLPANVFVLLVFFLLINNNRENVVRVPVIWHSCLYFSGKKIFLGASTNKVCDATSFICTFQHGSGNSSKSVVTWTRASISEFGDILKPNALILSVYRLATERC